MREDPMLELQGQHDEVGYVGEPIEVADTRYGRLLCRLRLHKWGFIEAVDKLDDGRTWCVILSYCIRPDCLEPIHVADSRAYPPNYAADDDDDSNIFSLR